MKKFHLSIVLTAFVTALLVTGCGGSSQGGKPNPTVTYRLNGADYLFVDKGTLQTSDTAVTGTGSLIFNAPVVDADNNYALSFTVEEGGSLSLITHAEVGLKNGVSLAFARNTDGKFKVTLAAGAESYDLSDDFAGFDAKGTLAPSIDIHSHGHVIVWVGEEKVGEYAFTTKTQLRFWGLVLSKAAVTQAEAGKAKEEH